MEGGGERASPRTFRRADIALDDGPAWASRIATRPRESTRTSHPPTFTVGALVMTDAEGSLSVSGLSQTPKDLQNDPGRLSCETPRLWRSARRAARSERDLAQPCVLNG